MRNCLFLVLVTAIVPPRGSWVLYLWLCISPSLEVIYLYDLIHNFLYFNQFTQVHLALSSIIFHIPRTPAPAICICTKKYRASNSGPSGPEPKYRAACRGWCLRLELKLRKPLKITETKPGDIGANKPTPLGEVLYTRKRHAQAARQNR